MTEGQNPEFQDKSGNPLREGFYLFEEGLAGVVHDERGWGIERPKGGYLPQNILPNYLMDLAPVEVVGDEIRGKDGKLIRMLDYEDEDDEVAFARKFEVRQQTHRQELSVVVGA